MVKSKLIKIIDKDVEKPFDYYDFIKKEYVCKQCSKRFTTMIDARIHINKHIVVN